MKLYRLCFLFLLFACFTVTAQNSSSLDSAMRSVKSGKLETALPVFKRILQGSNEALSQKAVITLSEYFIDNRELFSNDPARADMGNMLIAWSRSMYSKTDRTVTDLYAIGISAYAVLSTNTLRKEGIMNMYQVVLGALGDAARQGYVNASPYMASALRSYKNYDKAVPYSEIIAWANKAAVDTKSPKPLLDMVDDYTTMFWWSNAQKADTVKQLIFGALNAVSGSVPDSFYVATDHMWKKVFNKTTQDSHMQDILTEFFSAATNISTPAVKTGVAWHYMYLYLYDRSMQERSPGKQEEVHQNALKKILEIYNNDPQQLLQFMGAFGSVATSNLTSTAMGVNWLRNFTPQAAVNSQSFYKGAAATGQDIFPFLQKEAQPSLYVEAINKEYSRRLLTFKKMIGDEETMYKGYMGDTLRACIINAVKNDRDVMSKLMQLPVFANNTAAKYNYANANFLYHHAFSTYKFAVTTEVDALPSLFTAWTLAEKKNFDLRFYKALLSSLDFIHVYKSTLETTPVKYTSMDPFTRKQETTVLHFGDQGSKAIQQTIEKLESIFK